MIHAYPKDWTPKKAYNFATRRIEKIKFLLEEISGCYDGVVGSVENEVDRIYRNEFADLEEILKDVLEEEKTP